MKDWRTPLRAALARDDEERLSAAEASRMRATTLAGITSEGRKDGTFAWMRPVALAATVVAMVAAGIVAGRRLDVPVASTNVDPSQDGLAMEAGATQTRAPQSTSRQLQFLTPGGTRIIWVFNSELNLKETMR